MCLMVITVNLIKLLWIWSCQQGAVFVTLPAQWAGEHLPGTVGMVGHFDKANQPRDQTRLEFIEMSNDVKIFVVKVYEPCNHGNMCS